MGGGGVYFLSAMFFLSLQFYYIMLPSVSFLKPVELWPDSQEALRQDFLCTGIMWVQKG